MLAALEWNNQPSEIILWFDTSLLARGVSPIPLPPNLLPLQIAISSSRKDYSQVHCLKFGMFFFSFSCGGDGSGGGCQGGETLFVKYLQSVGNLVIQQASVES